MNAVSMLPVVWILIIGFAVVMYVLLDGFTLGTGMILPFLSEREREVAASVILPTWDGNQTWLVLGAASLYGAFPLAFSALLPVLYLPLLVMVIALLFRGVVFEFRVKAKGEKYSWDMIFGIASLAVALVQGLVLGNFVEGFILSVHPYLISAKSFFSPFCLFTAISVAIGYALLGATRLVLKTEGGLQEKMFKLSWWLSFLVAFCFLVVSIWTPFTNPPIFERWFSDGHWLYLGVLPYISALIFLILWISLYKREEYFPYWCVIGTFFCAYLGFGISLFPYIVPYQMTIWQAASPTNSLTFLLVGAAIMLPVLLIYTGYSYHIFRGKVRDVAEY